MPGMTKSERLVKAAGKEVKENPPAVLAKTRAKKGAEAAEAQRRAIVLSKARQAGARIKKKRLSARGEAKRAMRNQS